MIRDVKLIFSDNQAITESDNSEDTIDLGATGLDIGQGNPIYLEIWLDTAFDTSSDTLTITLRDGTTVGAISNTVMTVLPAIATSSLLAADVGLLVKFSLPEGLNRHLDLYYAVSSTLVSGKINAFLTIG